jgi:phospholipid-binding lipoprotein MlaA
MPPAVRPFSRLRALAVGAAISMTLLGGCATSGDPRDPLEPLNRGIYKFNDGVDALLIKPGGEFYSLIVPEWIRTGVSNFFSNLNDDFATGMGLEKHEEDFGQTLGYWGLGDGPYIVLPIFGPSNLRDTVGWVGDFYAWPVTYIEHDRTRRIVIGLRVVSGRAELLAASSILETAALDPYAFVRDAYLQRRRNLVYDGKPPLDDDDPDPEAKPKPVTQ